MGTLVAPSRSLLEASPLLRLAGRAFSAHHCWQGDADNGPPSAASTHAIPARLCYLSGRLFRPWPKQRDPSMHWDGGCVRVWLTHPIQMFNASSGFQICQ